MLLEVHFEHKLVALAIEDSLRDSHGRVQHPEGRLDVGGLEHIERRPDTHSHHECIFARDSDDRGDVHLHWVHVGALGCLVGDVAGEARHHTAEVVAAIEVDKPGVVAGQCEHLRVATHLRARARHILSQAEVGFAGCAVRRRRARIILAQGAVSGTVRAAPQTVWIVAVGAVITDQGRAAEQAVGHAGDAIAGAS